MLQFMLWKHWPLKVVVHFIVIDVIQLQPLNPSGIQPDNAILRLTKESELRQGIMLGAGAFGTVYRV